MTIVNLSVLKNGRAKAIRFSTLTAICDVLHCQPGDILGVRTEDGTPADDARWFDRRTQRRTTEGATVAEEVRAEMVANVWKIVVAEGDSVDDGDTLVILESMKMEIPMIAETAGTVSSIAVSEGDVVQEGDLIAVID